MALSFPSSPSIGDEFTAGGFTWVWNGTAWSKLAEATSAANDFALLVGSSGDTTYILDRTYTAGRYTIDLVNNDATYDIYAIAENGTYAGYSNTNSIEITADFTEVVVLGADNGETVLFTYQGTLTSPSSAGDVATAGAFINSVVSSALPNIDDTTVVNGGNFAADVTVSFIGQDTTETAAKSVVRNSSTELVATRPDDFDPNNSPYTVKVANPGIPVPAGANAHLLSNAVTAGTNPVWQTPADINYNIDGFATNLTLLATDTESSDIDYSIVSGSLPAGLSLNGETGLISGTFSGSANEGDVTAITFRATDAGGNFLDKAFNLAANTAPAWTTPAGAIEETATPNNVYTYQLQASTGTQGGSLSYTLQSGSLLTGLTLSSSGEISGVNTDPIGTTPTFTIRVTDSAGAFTDRQFSIEVVEPIYQLTATYNTTTTHTFAASTSVFAAIYVGGGSNGQNGYTVNSGASGHGGQGGSASYAASFYDQPVSAGSQMVMTVGAAGGTTSIGNLANASVNGANTVTNNGVTVQGPSGGAGGAERNGTFDNGAAGGSGSNMPTLTIGSTDPGLPTDVTNAGSGGGGGSGAHLEYGGQGVTRNGGSGGAGGSGAGSGGRGGSVPGGNYASDGQNGTSANAPGGGGGGGGGAGHLSSQFGAHGAGMSGHPGQILIYEK